MMTSRAVPSVVEADLLLRDVIVNQAVSAEAPSARKGITRAEPAQSAEGSGATRCCGAPGSRASPHEGGCVRWPSSWHGWRAGPARPWRPTPGTASTCATAHGARRLAALATARAVHEAYPSVDGLLAPSSMAGDTPTVALAERAEGSLPVAPRPALGRAAARAGYAIVP